MNSRKNISDELKAISPAVDNIQPLNPFSVPAGYFNTLSEQIMMRIKSGSEIQQQVYPADELKSLSPLLSQLDKKMPFSVPEGYFENLGGSVMEGRHAIGQANNLIEGSSDLLTGLKNKTTYQIPSGYFENLPNQLLARARNQGSAKIVRMRFSSSVTRYAVAAIIIGMLLISGFLFYNNQDSISTNQVAGIEQVSQEELENYITTQSVIISEMGVNTAAAEMDGEDIQEIFADLTDESLERYVIQYTDAKLELTN